jgi:hypothetical protein
MQQFIVDPAVRLFTKADNLPHQLDLMSIHFYKYYFLINNSVIVLKLILQQGSVTPKTSSCSTEARNPHAFLVKNGTIPDLHKRCGGFPHFKLNFSKLCINLTRKAWPKVRIVVRAIRIFAVGNSCAGVTRPPKIGPPKS